MVILSTIPIPSKPHIITLVRFKTDHFIYKKVFYIAKKPIWSRFKNVTRPPTRREKYRHNSGYGDYISNLLQFDFIKNGKKIFYKKCMA